MYRHQIKILEERLANIQGKLDETVKENIRLQEFITVIEVRRSESDEPYENTLRHELNKKEEEIAKLSQLLQESAHHIE